MGLHRFDLVTRQHRHRVVVDSGLLRATAQWFVDDDLWAEKSSWSQEFSLRGPEGSLGEIEVFTAVPARPHRVAWQAPDRGVSDLLSGGTELTPEPGSYAERRRQRAREHPTLFVLVAMATPVLRWGLGLLASFLAGLVLVGLVVAIGWPHLPLPSLPSISLPHLPLPDITWPDLPDLPDLPGWVGTVLKVGLGVSVAWGLARREVSRRHEQDERRAREDAALRHELLTGVAVGLEAVRAERIRRSADVPRR